MSRAQDGWWIAPVAPVAGDRYGFVVNGEGPFPDPRSPSQPDGVHALSEHIDHSDFHWTDGHWQAPPLSAAVIYELHIGTFTDTGTFAAAIERLPDLVELGVTHIEVMPIASFAGARGWGYDGVALFAPHRAYGGPLEVKRFVNACHEYGLAVILDVVYNHLGPDGNYLGMFAPYFTERHCTPWGAAVNFDGRESVEVRRFICDNAVSWLRDYLFDGLRLDAVHALVDTSATHILEQLSCEVAELQAALGRHFVLIAESDVNDPRVVQHPAAGGFGIDAQWSDDFHHALHTWLTGERQHYYADFGEPGTLTVALTRPFVYAGQFSPFRRRTHGRSATGIPGWQFVVVTQNHDQVGNRPRGERLSQLVTPGRLKIAAALLLCAPFVPLIFQGFTSFDDTELGRQVSEGRRRECGALGEPPESVPDPQSLETFERSRLRWQERSQEPHAGVLDWYRRLIAFRRSTPSLTDGRYVAVAASMSGDGRSVQVRRGGVLLACNIGAESIRVPADEHARLLLVSDECVSLTRGELLLPAETVAILGSE
jgi:maltooligosyltrehalose trehalohydrolase